MKFSRKTPELARIAIITRADIRSPSPACVSLICSKIKGNGRRFNNVERIGLHPTCMLHADSGYRAVRKGGKPTRKAGTTAITVRPKVGTCQALTEGHPASNRQGPQKREQSVHKAVPHVSFEQWYKLKGKHKVARKCSKVQTRRMKGVCKMKICVRVCGCFCCHPFNFSRQSIAVHLPVCAWRTSRGHPERRQQHVFLCVVLEYEGK